MICFYFLDNTWINIDIISLRISLGTLFSTFTLQQIPFMSLPLKAQHLLLKYIKWQ